MVADALSWVPSFGHWGVYEKYESVSACCMIVFDTDHDYDIYDIFQDPIFS